jgi:hypothetical protein
MHNYAFVEKQMSRENRDVFVKRNVAGLRAYSQCDGKLEGHLYH